MIKEGLEIVDKTRKYKLIKKIGQGGQGSVYLAETLMNNQQQQQIMALKFTPKIYVSNQETQFLDVLQQYQNSDGEKIFPSNIIKIYDFFSYNEYIVTVMEQGQQSLYQYLCAKQGQISIQEQVNLCIDITNSIYFLHQNNIMHRDIKPENFMFVGNKIKLIDFGLLRTPDQRMTIGVGTQLYSAPEIITNQSNYTNSVDVWSLACVFYAIIKQQNLFNIVQEILNHKNNQEILFTKINDLNCDQDLKNVIKQMLQYDPNKRINSSQIIQFLQQIKEKLSINQFQQQNNQNVLNRQNPIPPQFYNKQYQQNLDILQQNRVQNLDQQFQQQQQYNQVNENLEKSLKQNFEQMLNEKILEMNLKINNEIKEQINNFTQQQQVDYNSLKKQQDDQLNSINQTIQTNQLDQNKRLDQLEQLINSQIDYQFKQKLETQQNQIQQLNSLIEEIKSQLKQSKELHEKTLDQKFSQITSNYVTISYLNDVSLKLSQQQQSELQQQLLQNDHQYKNIQKEINGINAQFQNSSYKQQQFESEVLQIKNHFELQLDNLTQNLINDSQQMYVKSLQSNEQQILQINKEIHQTKQDIQVQSQTNLQIIQYLQYLQQQFQQQEQELKNQSSNFASQNNHYLYYLSSVHNLVQQSLNTINQQISDLKLQMFDENQKIKIEQIIKDCLGAMNLDLKIQEIQQTQKDLQQQLVLINNNQENKIDQQMLYESYNIKSSLTLIKFQLNNFQEQYLYNKKKFYYYQPLQKILAKVTYDQYLKTYVVPFKYIEKLSQYKKQQTDENEKIGQKNNTIQLLKDFKSIIDEFKIIGNKVNEQQAIYFLLIFLKQFKKSPQFFIEKLSQINPNLLNMLKQQIENINNSQLF